MSTDNIGAGRPQRGCHGCGQVDDHPRHTFARKASENTGRAVDTALVLKAIDAADAGDRERIASEMSGDRGLMFHMDCCRAAGCPDGSCDRLPSESRGVELLDVLLSEQETSRG